MGCGATVTSEQNRFHKKLGQQHHCHQIAYPKSCREGQQLENGVEMIGCQQDGCSKCQQNYWFKDKQNVIDDKKVVKFDKNNQAGKKGVKKRVQQRGSMLPESQTKKLNIQRTQSVVFQGDFQNQIVKQKDVRGSNLNDQKLRKVVEKKYYQNKATYLHKQSNNQQDRLQGQSHKVHIRINKRTKNSNKKSMVQLQTVFLDSGFMINQSSVKEVKKPQYLLNSSQAKNVNIEQKFKRRDLNGSMHQIKPSRQLNKNHKKMFNLIDDKIKRYLTEQRQKTEDCLDIIKP